MSFLSGLWGGREGAYTLVQVWTNGPFGLDGRLRGADAVSDCIDQITALRQSKKRSSHKRISGAGHIGHLCNLWNGN